MTKKKRLSATIAKIATVVFCFCVAWCLLFPLLGAMNLLPLKEWPVGYPSAIQVGTHYVVPIETLSRVQIYDDDFKFQKSVWVNSQGGVIYLYSHNEQSFWVYTLKGKNKLHIRACPQSKHGTARGDFLRVQGNYCVA